MSDQPPRASPQADAGPRIKPKNPAFDLRLIRREARRLAMQLMYQLSMGTEATEAALNAHVQDIIPEAEDGLTADPPAVQEEAVALALAAWETIGAADALINELSPDWPVNRQPAVDRAILRLAHFELKTQRVPARVAMNEAIELAKAYASESSPAFVNGVVDKLAKKLGIDAATHQADTDRHPAPSSDGWLNDAVNN